MRFICFMLVVLCGSSLAAQASIPLSGTVSGTDQRAQIVSVDFGAAPQSLQLDVSIAATSGTSGLGCGLFDLEAVAATGTAGAVEFGDDTGTGTITYSLTTGTYSGVVEFMVVTATESGLGTSPYTGTLSCATLSTGDITAGSTQTIANPMNSTVNVLGRLRIGNRTLTGVHTEEFDVDFGSSAQSITFFMQGRGDASGSIEIVELDSGGSPLTPFSVSGTGSWFNEGNPTSTSRSGIVRFRLTATPSAAGEFDWTLIFPMSVTVGGGGGGGGGDDDEGCSTGEETNLAWLGLLALLGVLGVAARLRA